MRTLTATKVGSFPNYLLNRSQTYRLSNFYHVYFLLQSSHSNKSKGENIMKNLFYVLTFTVSLQSFAEDMSRTENYKTAYRDLADGTSEYIGACSTHEDHQDKLFVVTKTLVKYFTPTNTADTNRRLSVLEPELIGATEQALQDISGVDDFTAEKISSLKLGNLDLYRLNVGVGGGNGMFLVFNRTIKNAHVVYELMSMVMDGDIEFCDSKVWISTKN